MLNGDISNAVQARYLLIFEGNLGYISGESVDAFNSLAREGAWGEAWDQWTLNEMMMRKIWDVTQRQGVSVTIATLLVPQEFCDVAALGLQETLDSVHLPVTVLAMPGETLAREIAFMPDVAAVYDAGSSWSLFGRKGIRMRDYNDFGGSRVRTR